jgi:hypothetical protein
MLAKVAGKQGILNNKVKLISRVGGNMDYFTAGYYWRQQMELQHFYSSPNIRRIV